MWLTRRPILNSNDDMPAAITTVLVGFVSELVAQGEIKRWYSSLKNYDGIPSFRLYLEIDDDGKQAMVSKLDNFLRSNSDQIGWTGDYVSPDPEFNPAHVDLNEIMQACQSVLKLATMHPSVSRVCDAGFWKDVRAEIDESLSSMDPVHHGAYIHFVANNFGIPDNAFLDFAGFRRT